MERSAKRAETVSKAILPTQRRIFSGAARLAMPTVTRIDPPHCAPIFGSGFMQFPDNCAALESKLKVLEQPAQQGMEFYDRAAGFAAKISVKLSRYCRKTSTHSTLATSAGTMVAGASVR